MVNILLTPTQELIYFVPFTGKLYADILFVGAD